MLKLHDTLSRQLRPLEPLVPGQVGMYVCGITVYDLCHIGHARMLIVFDVLYRHLLASGLKVTYVRNITDIEDKIIRRAGETGETVDELTSRSIAALHADEAVLNVLRPTHEPRATGSIDAMLSLIGTLIERGHAYAVEGGDVYYSVSSFADYGKLSGRRLAELRAGERVAIDEHKRDPLDFVLWKAAKPGEPAWPSPWGEGRPGWHIECSAMAMQLLGERFDLHGGGNDLVFPHHENEIAQSEACTGQSMATLWVHNGMVRVDEEKMSKSLGNFFTIRDILEKFSGEEIRLFILSSHYRSPLNFSDQQLEAARTALRRLYMALRNVPGDPRPDVDIAEGQSYIERFNTAMNNDLATPEALAVLFDLAGALNREQNARVQAQLALTLRALGARLGLLESDPDAVLKGRSGTDTDELTDAAVDALVAERNEARTARDFARSDAIRDRLQSAGVILEDSGEHTRWRRA